MTNLHNDTLKLKWFPGEREFVCGWGAASINVIVTFPLNKVMFRQQLYGIKSHTAIKQLQREGLLLIYRGLLPPFLQKTTSMSLMFGMYDTYKRLIGFYIPDMPILVNKTTSGILAGCTEAILCPFERVQVLMQDKHYHDLYKNTFHSFKVLQQYGIAEYYRGLMPIVVRNGMSNAMFFLCRDHIKSYFPESTSKSTEVALNFLSGAVLGASISTVFYPVNVVKTRMQSQVGGEFMGFGEAFQIVFQERNNSWRKLFRGVHINFTRSLVSWGIVNASYELIKEWLYPGTSSGNSKLRTKNQ